MTFSLSPKRIASRIEALETEKADTDLRRVYMAAQPDPDVEPEFAMGPDGEEYVIANIVDDPEAFVIVLTARVPS